MSNNKKNKSKSPQKPLGDDQFTVVYRLDTGGPAPMYCINEDQVKAEVATDKDIQVDYALVTHFQLEDGRFAFHLAELEESTWHEVKDVSVL